MGWIWVSVIVLAVIIELLTDQLISIWFVPGAMVATILDFCNQKIITQVIVFLVISIVGIILGKTLLQKYLPNTKDTKTNIDAIIGEKCVVNEKIDNLAGCGQVKVNGQIWSYAKNHKLGDIQCYSQLYLNSITCLLLSYPFFLL